jgi:hypothetical protein
MRTAIICPNGLIIHPAVTILDQSMDGYAAEHWPLRFIVSLAKEQDGKRWLHASVSRVGGGMPSYDDLKKLKEYCIGETRTALQVFPPKAKHIDLAGPHGVEVLHLWSCMDGDVTPDFSRGGKTI